MITKNGIVTSLRCAYLVVVVLALFTLIEGCRQGYEAADVPKGWVTYTDVQTGISLMYPDDWKKIEVRGLTVLQNPTSSPTRLSVIASKAASGVSATDFLAADEPERYKRSKLTVNGKEASLREGSPSDHPDWKRLEVFWNENKDLLSVTCSSNTPEAWDTNRSICMQIFATIKVR
jgi:hypothetical protein